MAYQKLPRLMIDAAIICSFLNGCASFEPKADTAESVTNFENDKSACREQANRLNGSTGDDAVAGMFVGALIGASEGAAVGVHQGGAGDGAWIGSAAGAGLGLFIGLGKGVMEYNASYRKCMEGRQYTLQP